MQTCTSMVLGPDIASAVGGLEYDVLLIGGDMYDEWTPDLDPLVDLLASLRGPKLAVLGNHDYDEERRAGPQLQRYVHGHGNGRVRDTPSSRCNKGDLHKRVQKVKEKGV